MSIAIRLLGGDAFAFETLTVVDAVNKFTVATFTAGSDSQSHIRAVVTAEGGMMRYKYNGQNPSTTSGHLLAHGDILLVEGSANVANFRVIRTGNTSGVLSISYERVY